MRRCAEAELAQDDPHFRLRLPVDLKAFIAAEAVMSRRSLNAEIVFRLEQSRKAQLEPKEAAGQRV